MEWNLIVRCTRQFDMKFNLRIDSKIGENRPHWTSMFLSLFKVIEKGRSYMKWKIKYIILKSFNYGTFLRFYTILTLAWNGSKNKICNLVPLMDEPINWTTAVIIDISRLKGNKKKNQYFIIFYLIRYVIRINKINIQT